LADESSAVTTAAPDTTTAATPGVRATAASLEPSLPARIPTRWKELADMVEAEDLVGVTSVDVALMCDCPADCAYDGAPHIR